MIKKIPNFLTSLRVLLVPLFIWLMFFNKTSYHNLWATLVFIAASITDYYDGMLARKYNAISNFGKVMDPLADKILVITALLALALPPVEYISIFVVIIILFRELAVTVLRHYYASKNIFIPANIWGKLKTMLQMTGIITALIYLSISPFIKILKPYNSSIILFFNIFFWLVAAITLLSGMNYFFIKYKKSKG